MSAVSEDGTWALSINYARLYLVRPDYGYAGEGQNPRRGVVFPEDDGLWRVDVATGEALFAIFLNVDGIPFSPWVTTSQKVLIVSFAIWAEWLVCLGL